MTKRWTVEEERRLTQIALGSYGVAPYNWHKAAVELKRSASACKRKYWEIKDREWNNAPRDEEST